MGTEGKTVKLKEENTGKMRIWKNRNPFDVVVPDSVREIIDDCPVSVTITPMTHREAEVRTRLKKKLQSATVRCNSQAGIYESDVTLYNVELATIRGETELPEGATEEQQEDAYGKLTEFQKKWEWFTTLIRTRDESIVWEAEDELHDNSMLTVVNNCKSINWEDRQEEVKPDGTDFLHPDFLSWILYQIEDNSYLTEGEITGLL